MENSALEGAVSAAAGADRPVQAMGPAIAPLRVVGLAVTGPDLAAHLRPTLPQLVTVTPLEHDRFLLLLAGANQGEQQSVE